MVTHTTPSSSLPHMYLAMMDGPQLQQQDISIWLALQMKFERTQ
ncbi:hypothetical protein Tco_0589773, partial [Tanacetum coccineum]